MVSRKTHFAIIFALLIASLITLSWASMGRWGDGDDGIAICDADSNQKMPTIISDDAKGAIIVWNDVRPSAEGIYAQRVNIYGSTQWTDDGVAACATTGNQTEEQATIDGEGGVIIAWLDERVLNDYYIYAQRIDSAGTVKWATNGVKVDTTAEAHQHTKPAITTDDNGGAIIAWGKGTDVNVDLFAQRINSSGAFQWDSCGTTICDATNNQGTAAIARDGSGGAIIAWLDSRDHSSNEIDVYAQKINSSGVVQWTTNGVAIYDSTYKAYNPAIVPDSSGGAIISWIDKRQGSTYAIWAQHIDSVGDVNWARNGVKVADVSGNAGNIYSMTVDSLGGTVVVYHKVVSSNRDIYATRIDVYGTRRWTTNVSNQVDDQWDPAVCADSAGGVIIAWKDDRDAESSSDIYCQRLDIYGEIRWHSGGIIACDADNVQEKPVIIYNDDWDAIIAWQHNEGIQNKDIYAQRIEAPMPSCSVSVSYADSLDFFNSCPASDWPNDSLDIEIGFIDSTMLRDIEASEMRLYKSDTFFVFWNEDASDTGSYIVAESPATKENDYKAHIIHKSFSVSDTSKSCSSNDLIIKFSRFADDTLSTANDVLVKSVDRNGDGYVGVSDLVYLGHTYGVCIPSDSFDCWMEWTGDSCVKVSEFTAFGNHYTHEHDTTLNFMPPLEESSMIVEFEGENKTLDGKNKHLVTIYLEYITGNTLIFMSLDFSRNKLIFDDWHPNTSYPHRSAVAPISKNGDDWLAAAAFKLDLYASNIIEMGTLEFTVKDDSEPINEDDIWINFADVLETNGKVKKIQGAQYFPGEETPTFTTRLSGNYPNPFNPSTIIEYSIAKDDHVNLSIYNVNGQLVRTLVDEFQKRNEYKAVWDGKNNRGKTVASGVYFLQMKTDAYMMTKKLVILR